MTVMIVPNEVVRAQAELLSAEIELLVTEVREAICPVDEGCPSHDDPIRRDEALAKLHEALMENWRVALDYAPGSGAVRSDGPSSERQSLPEGTGKRSELLFGRVNLRLGQPLLWLLRLMGSIPLNTMLLGLNSDFAIGMGAVMDLAWSFIDEPSFGNVKKSITVLEERDYPFAYRAVELSCGNPFGIAISPKAISAQDLFERCRRHDEDNESRRAEELVDSLCAAINNISSVDVDLSATKRKLESAIKTHLPKIIERSEALVTPPAMPLDYLGISASEQLGRCQEALELLTELGMFQSVGRGDVPSSRERVGIDARIVKRSKPEPGSGEPERVVLDAMVSRMPGSSRYVYRIV